MARIMTVTMEVTDEEATNFMNRFAERGDAVINETTNVTNVAAPASPTAPVSGEQLLDDHGVQWDARYHATTKTKKANGGWKAAKGMDDATKAAAAAYEASFKNPTPAAPTPPAAPVTEEPAEEVVASAAPTPPAAPVAPTAPAIPAAPATPAPVSFEELTAGFGEVIGRIGQDALMAQLGQIYADAGVDSEGTSLQTNETQRSQVLAAIKAL
jgi:hypothetical protein